MIREELEFRIARYADGDLSAAERRAVEAELAADPEARAVLAEYRTLRTAIEEAAGPALPKVHWDRLEQLLSAAVARSDGPASGESEGPSQDGGPFAGELAIEQEFAIACHTDGSLLPQDRADVERLLAGDARARAMYDEYHDVDAATKSLAYSDVMPAVPWDRLTAQISGTVDAGAKAALEENLERQIAEFTEGSLPANQLDAVETRLAGDAAARVMAYEYDRLDAELQAIWAAPLPAVNWTQFAERISANIDLQGSQRGRSRKRDSDGYSILKWLHSPTRMALAASVLIAVGVTARLMYHGSGSQPGHPEIVAAPAPIEEIAVLNPEQPAGESQSQVEIGPPTTVAQAGADDEVGDDEIISHPPKVFVASGRSTATVAEAVPATPF